MGIGSTWLAAPRGLGLAQDAGNEAPRKKPNFVFILIDDMGWKDLGFMGNKFLKTPNTDRLAKEGIKFTNAYACGPNCAPSRASILSGQYTPRHGIYTVNNSDRGLAKLRMLIPIENKKILEPGVVTLAEALKASGYVCASVGKWHLGEDPETGPLGQGFSVNIGGNEVGHPPAGYFAPYDLPNLEDAPHKEYLTDRLTDEAVGFIEQNKDRPFFLYLSHYAVHTPLQAPEELVSKYEAKRRSPDHNAMYAAMIERVDQGIGRVLDKLNELGIEDDTVVIFTSDNGGLSDRGITSMEPLRGGKGTLYDGGIRVPMAVRWPGKIKAGSKCDTPVIGIDFYPTLLELAGAKKPEGHVLDGKSIVPLLRGDEALEREAIFWHFPAYLEGYSKGARDIAFRTRPCGVVRAGDFKLIEYFEDGALELYNLEEDLSEKNDLAKEMPDKVKEMLGIMRSWRESVNAPVPTERNPAFGARNRKQP